MKHKKKHHSKSDSLLRSQIRTAAEIFNWLEQITESENDAVHDIMFEDDKPVMCLYCVMKRKSFRIFTEINTENSCIAVSISFAVNCTDDNKHRIYNIINTINSELNYGFFRLDAAECEVRFRHAYPYSDKIDFALFKKMFIKYLVTTDINSGRIIRTANT